MAGRLLEEGEGRVHVDYLIDQKQTESASLNRTDKQNSNILKEHLKHSYLDRHI